VIRNVLPNTEDSVTLPPQSLEGEANGQLKLAGEVVLRIDLPEGAAREIGIRGVE
jgi:hypothetical protein